MTQTSGERQKAMEDLYRAARGDGTGTSPGRYLFWFLGQLVDPAEVLFSDWLSRQGQRNGPHRGPNGRAVLITADEIIELTFTNAPEDETHLQQMKHIPNPDALRMAWYPRGEIKSIDLSIDHLSPQRQNTSANWINIRGGSWTVQLPTDTLDDVAPWDYFERLKSALK